MSPVGARSGGSTGGPGLDGLTGNVRRAARPVLRSLCALMGIVLATCGDVSPSEVMGECENNPRQEVLELVNEIRVANGRSPLELDVRLAFSAQGHSEDMTANNFMAHTGSDGSNPGERMAAAGYPWSGWSENVAAGQPTPESVVNAWMNSDGHRANILRESSEHVGIGYDYATGTNYGHYWTMNFASSESAALAGTGCHP